VRRVGRWLAASRPAGVVEPVDSGRALPSVEVPWAVAVGLRFALAMACSISAVRVRPG
jgi:hypothetical protein